MLPTNIAEHVLQRWPFEELLCKLVLATDRCNIFSSVYFPAAMSMDRYLVVPAMVLPRRTPRHTVRGAEIPSLCTWLGVTVAMLPFFTLAGVYSNELQVTSCGLSCPRPERAWFQAISIYTPVLGLAVPTGTLYVLYVEAAGPAAPLRSQGSGQGQAEGESPGPGCAGRGPALLDALPPGLSRGPDHRPAPDATGHHHLLCRHQPRLHQLLPQPLPLGLPGPQLLEEPLHHVPVPGGISTPPSQPTQP